MNRHFARTDFQHDGRYRRPTRLFGSLDHIERGVQFTLAAFDCVDAEWLDDQHKHPQFGGYFNGADPHAAGQFWRGFWKAVKQPGHNPLDDMPLFRIEVDLPTLSHLTSTSYGLHVEDSDPDLAAAESTWLEFMVSDVAQRSSFQAQLYHGMFLPPNPVFITAKELGADSKAKVVLEFMMDSLSDLDAPDKNDLESALRSAEADYLGVWDVGQGNANALLDGAFRATTYFDLGCGVYRNAWTRPANLEFCWGDPGSEPEKLSLRSRE